MIKKNKWKLIFSSIIILLPAVVGAYFWSALPQQLPTHWGIDGLPNAWSSRLIAVFVMPLVVLALHWIGVLVTAADPRNKNQTEKAKGLVFWICPFISLLVGAMIYASAFGVEFGIFPFTIVGMGLMFVVFGNYMPKCKQNSTLGIRVKWTLENEENWHASHRFGGKVWVIGGMLLMLCAFLPESILPFVLTVSILILAFVPVVYSYIYHVKQVKNGTAGHKRN